MFLFRPSITTVVVVVIVVFRFIAACFDTVVVYGQGPGDGGVRTTVPSTTTTTSRHRSLQQAPMMGVIDSLLLYDATTDQPIVALTDGMVINIATMNTTSFNIQATTTTNGPVGSIQFGYNTNPKYRIESLVPYAFCGNTHLNYFPCPVLSVGPQHNITATSYSGTQATGTITSITKVSFRIVNTTAPTTAAPMMKPPPTKAPIIQSSPTMTPPTIQTPMIKAPIPCTFPKFTTGWQRFTPDYPIKVLETQATLIGNDIILFGGFNNTESDVTNRTYVKRDSGTDTVSRPWIRMDDMPLPTGVTHAAVAVNGTILYVCGGYVGPNFALHTPLCYKYDHGKAPGIAGQSQWSSFTSLPNDGTGSGAMIYDTVKNALFYTGGAQRPFVGSRDIVDQSATYKYSFHNPSLGWVISTPIPYTSNHPSYATVKIHGKERHYFFGGQRGRDQLTGSLMDVFEFVASNETWVRRKSMPYGRSHASISANPMGPCGFVVAGGAIDGVGKTGALNSTGDIHYYHIPFDNWTHIGNLLGKRSAPFVVTSSDYMYFITEVNSHRRQYSA